MTNSATKRLEFSRELRLAGYSPIPKSVVDSHGVPMELGDATWRFNIPSLDRTFCWDQISRNPWLEYALQRYIIEQLQRVSPVESFNTAYTIQRNLELGEKIDALLDAGDIDDHVDSLADAIRAAIAYRKKAGQLYEVTRLRAWYIWCAKHIPDIGFDEDFAFELSQMSIPGNEHGHAVRTEDPEDGPLDDTELGQITAALNGDDANTFEFLQQRCALAICVAFGRNSANFALLREEDVHRLVDDPEVTTEWAINLPRIKKRKRPRQDFREEVLSETLQKHVNALIDFNRRELPALPPGVARPLFARRTPRNTLLIGPMREWACHMTSGEFRALVSQAVRRYGIVSARTGQPMHITPRRLRYTLATKLVRLGVGAATLAEILDHSDVQTVRVYFDSRANIVEQLDRAGADRMAPIVAAFRGRIVGSAADAINGSDLSKRILLPGEAIGDRQLSDCELGICGLHRRCGLEPPFSCYDGCKKFQAFRDGPHEVALSFLLDRRNGQLEDPHKRRFAIQLDRTILGVTQLIQEVAAK